MEALIKININNKQSWAPDVWLDQYMAEEEKQEQ